MDSMATALSVTPILGRGRGVVARSHIQQGALLLSCTPIAAVLKQAAGACMHCSQCMRVVTHRSASALANGVPPPNVQYCGARCAADAAARGGNMLARADLRPLEALHEEQGRKFPLLAAQVH